MSTPQEQVYRHIEAKRAELSLQNEVGMFEQSLKFIESHHFKTKNISAYGQDQWAWGAHLRQAKRARRVRQWRKLPNQFTATTYKLAKMNLAVRGLSANLGEVPADTFFKDQHPDLKADYIMANPPFNLKDWRGPDTAMRGSAKLKPEGTPQVVSEARNKLVHDGCWNGYETPPTGNANYAWILHMVSKLSDWSGATKTNRQGCPEGERGGANQNGGAGFVLANCSMSTNTTGEGEIRQKMLENDDTFKKHKFRSKAGILPTFDHFAGKSFADWGWRPASITQAAPPPSSTPVPPPPDRALPAQLRKDRQPVGRGPRLIKSLFT